MRSIGVVTKAAKAPAKYPDNKYVAILGLYVLWIITLKDSLALTKMPAKGKFIAKVIGKLLKSE